MCMGAVGTISAAAHLCTERFVAMIECGLAGKIEDGRAHAEALLPVIRAAYADPNPAIFKGVLHAAGPHRDARRAPPADERFGRRHPALPRCGRATRRTRSLDCVSRRVAWFLIALCAWTLYVWITRVVIIARPGPDARASRSCTTRSPRSRSRSASAPATSASEPSAPADHDRGSTASCRPPPLATESGAATDRRARKERYASSRRRPSVR